MPSTPNVRLLIWINPPLIPSLFGWVLEKESPLTVFSISVLNGSEKEKGGLFQTIPTFEITLLQPPQKRLKMATNP